MPIYLKDIKFWTRLIWKLSFEKLDRTRHFWSKLYRRGAMQTSDQEGQKSLLSLFLFLSPLSLETNSLVERGRRSRGPTSVNTTAIPPSYIQRAFS